MDTRQSRRDAEKRARDLVSQRANLVGDLAVAQAARATAETNVEQAHERGRELVREAEARAAQLHQSAREEADAAERLYSDHHAAAVSGGWSPSDLEQLGYRAPDRRGRPRGAAPSTGAGTTRSIESTEHLRRGTEPAILDGGVVDEQQTAADDVAAHIG